MDLIKVYPNELKDEKEVQNLLDVLEITSALMAENKETTSFYEKAAHDRPSPNVEDVLLLTQKLKDLR